MKNDLALLTRVVEKKIGKKIHAQALHKVWNYLSGKEKPTQETLNKLALLLGYQSWDDFHEALEGEDDGDLSYDTDENHALKKGSSDDID